MQQNHDSDDDCRIQFRDDWLYQFYKYGKANRKIPATISVSLGRNLNPPLTGYSSIRVNDKYRLIFKWGENGVEDLYLDPHDYR
ncbi:type II toxin-antitoxin system RelE/ParE family toxin [Klebsiella pneumoniae]|uniref:type II toxin-antitoxin system RelE/ParE family toxin n=1 Tax=Klebsiella pneumoniae TaxID=573 RepID=UPI000E3C6520|nr:type II toxin-antitoxin system RelE/ParE family toxin [Klebsiella pneumoniae]